VLSCCVLAAANPRACFYTLTFLLLCTHTPAAMHPHACCHALTRLLPHPHIPASTPSPFCFHALTRLLPCPTRLLPRTHTPAATHSHTCCRALTRLLSHTDTPAVMCTLLHHHIPAAMQGIPTTVVEINRDVVDAAVEFFGYSVDEPQSTVVDDADAFLRRKRDGPLYDVVLMDLFNGSNPECATRSGVHPPPPHTHTRARARAHTHTRTRTHTHAHARTHTHTQLCIRTSLSLCCTACHTVQRSSPCSVVPAARLLLADILSLCRTNTRALK
jgi:hypothetical protein